MQRCDSMSGTVSCTKRNHVCRRWSLHKIVAALQARVEIGVLNFLNQRCDPHNRHHIVRMLDYFLHRRHLCLAFELLSLNLYELVKHNQFRGLSMNLLRVFLSQVRHRVPCEMAHTVASHLRCSACLYELVRRIQFCGQSVDRMRVFLSFACHCPVVGPFVIGFLLKLPLPDPVGSFSTGTLLFS